MFDLRQTVYRTCLLICLTSISLTLSSSIKFRSTRVKFNPKYFTNFTLSVKNEAIYNDMNIIKALPYGFQGHIDLQLRLPNSKRYQSLIAYDIDVCRTAAALKDNILKKWFKSLLKYGNYMENCPVNRGHYYLNGYRLDSSLIPTYLYPGDYRIKGLGYYGKWKGKNYEMVVDVEADAGIQ